jgi:hypothetical protein
MTNNQEQSFQHLTQPVAILKSCQALSDRLLLEGLGVKLTPVEEKQLLDFEQLFLTDYTPTDWTYLRIVSGLNTRAVAALSGGLALLHSKEPKPLYGQL